MSAHRDPHLQSSNGPVDAAFRSIRFWVGVLVACYCISILWLGDLFGMIPLVLFSAPSGLYHLVGVPEFENGFTAMDRVLSHQLPPIVMLLAAHAGFWGALFAYLSRRRRMVHAQLMTVGWTLIVVLVANLVGCSMMKYST